jgi:SWI/SNF-related matrix-associated actin-dependent regulator of chromatin subfamily A member 5
MSPSKLAAAKAEKARLRELKKQQQEELERVRREQNEKVAKEGNKTSKYKMLLAETEVFAHFLAGSKAHAAKEKKGKKARKETINEDEEDKEMVENEDHFHGTRLTVQPSCIKFGTMRQYQIEGLNWMIKLFDQGINGILADEMGLGKTLQTISLLGYLHEYRGITGPHLVVVPKSTLGNWMNEFKRWCPVLRVFKFHGNAEAREEQKRDSMRPGAFDVCVTSYEMVIKEKSALKKFHWRYIVIDEAHRLKNEKSRLAVTLRMLSCNNRMLITGTPLQNNLHELWALLNFLLPEVFAVAGDFDDFFANVEDEDGGSVDVVQQLHKVLRPFLLRRLKAEVEKSLPPKKETILKIGMSDLQKQIYKRILQKDIDVVNSGSDRARLLNMVMQLRKCCNHPYLFEGAEPGPPYITGEHLVTTSGKLILLDKLLPKLQERGSRVLIFSQMTRLLDVLEDYLMYRGYHYCRIDGNTDGQIREDSIEEYNRPGTQKFVFLLSTRAGGLGINLATADTVILYDSDWNPQMDLQAMDRAHRIGQKKEVSVFRFCTDNSVEEKVIEKAYKKLALDALVIQQGRLQQNQKSVNKEDLANMVRFGAENIFDSTAVTDLTAEDVDAIIAKGEEATKQLNEKMSGFTDKALKFSMNADASLYDFEEQEAKEEAKKLPEGIDMKAIISSNWIDPPKRERKKNYSENQYYKDQMNQGGRPSGKSGPRIARLQQMNDFQFFEVKKIQAFYDKDVKRKTYEWEKKQNRPRTTGPDGEEVEEPDDPKAPPALTQEEQEEYSSLLAAGFTDWNRRDFQLFCRACETHGRKNVEAIALDMEGKTLSEVKEYAKVFWERCTEISDWKRIESNIKKGEQRIQRQEDMLKAVKKKLSLYKNPWRELKVVYGPNKVKSYTEEEDRFLLCSITEVGFGNWEELKAQIRQHWQFRFDWFIKSRTPKELQRRVETLIGLIEKEADANDEKAAKKQKTTV